MKLYLVDGSYPTNTTLSLRRLEVDNLVTEDKDEEYKPIYRVSSPSLFKINEPTKIFKVGSTHPGESISSGNEVEDFARIHWHTLKSTRIIFKGESLELNSWLPRTDRWGSKRKFTGPDGRSYQWTLGPFESSLEVQDPTSPSTPSVEVARTHQLTLFPKSRGYLEIKDTFVSEISADLLDLIIATWVYVEKMRIDNFQPQ
ncbi:hypothetical protein C8Q75DRAFT_288891 [Abortiporus biennis]|nr:hypothetical protein C8Q75DRAFT_288891 [Abortiporus biennis]